MAHSITVKAHPSDQRPIYERLYNDPGELISNYFSFCRGRDSLNYLWAYVIPIRTGNVKNFCEDLFFPSHLIAQASEIEGIAKTIFLTIGFILGCATLWIRLITSVPRYLETNADRQNSPLHQHLTRNGIPQEALEKDRVYVTVQWLQRGDTLGPDFVQEANYIGSTERPISFIHQLPVDQERNYSIGYRLGDRINP